MIVVPTIDVEGVHGADPFNQMILGDIGGDYHGVFEIAGILSRFGAEGTFFVDVYESSLWGEDQFEKLCRDLDLRGQDVELHTHPGWRDDPCDFPWLRALKRKQSYVSGSKDFMTKLTRHEQQSLLRDGAAMIESWIGRRPFVHRAGGYSINADTFHALRGAGFSMDSSVHYGHRNCHYCPTVMRPAVVDGIFELPVTLMRYTPSLPFIGRYHRGKLLKTDIDTAWLGELKHYVDQGLRSGVRYMNLFMHSYSLITFDPTYRKFRYSRAKADVLAGFIEYCHDRSDVRIMSCRQILSDQSIMDYLLGSSDTIIDIRASRHMASLGLKMIKNRIYEHGIGEMLLRRQPH